MNHRGARSIRASRAGAQPRGAWALVLALVACGDDSTGAGSSEGTDASTSSTSGGEVTSPTAADTSSSTTIATSESSGDASTGGTTTGDDTTTDASTSDATTTGTTDTSTSESTTAADAICGDGVVDDGEVCDGDALGDQTCADLGFTDGELACLGDCSDFDTSACNLAGDCCDPHDTIGCADAACEAAICGADPFCCDDHWDGLCSDAALASPSCLGVGGACPCPDDAIFDALGPAVASGDTTNDDDDFGASCGGGDGNDRVIYFIAPEDGEYTFDTFGSAYDTKLSVRTSCLTEVACNDDAAGGVQSEVTVDLVAGQRVRIVIDGYNGSVGAWILNATFEPPGPPVCGDGEVDAPEICDGANLNGQTCIFQGFPGGGDLGCAGDCLTYDTTGCIDGPFACSDEDVGNATGPAVAAGNTGGDDDDLAPSCGGGNGDDHVVTFTAPAAGSYVFDTFGSAYDTKLALWADCISELYCNDDAGGLQSQLQINMGEGQQVLVVIDGFDGATGDWVLNITPP